LFHKINKIVKNKGTVKAAVIFLTHNKQKHKYNLENNLPGEELLWNPEIQEDKVSQYGGNNIRYRHELKYDFIKKWLAIHSKVIPWNKIRYVF